jgi:hypothetical protein
MGHPHDDSGLTLFPSSPQYDPKKRKKKKMEATLRPAKRHAPRRAKGKDRIPRVTPTPGSRKDVPNGLVTYIHT